MRNLMILGLAVGLLISGCSDESGDPLAPSHAVDRATDKAAVEAAGAHGDRMPATTVFQAHLDGGAEVPDPVDTDAQGQAVFRLGRDGTMLHYRLIVANIDDVIGAHVHLAPAGANGPIALALFGDPFVPDPGVTVNGLLAVGTATAEDVSGPIAGDLAALVEAMRAGDAYVNVHTVAHPPGEIRGQIR